jgi:ABC-2 type transport system permease protein
MLVRDTIAEATQTFVSTAAEGPVVPYVDLAGVIQTIPDDLKAAFRAFPDEASAKAALAEGDIAHYFLIPANFRQTGTVVGVSEHPSPMTGIQGSGPLDYVLRLNVAGGNLVMASPVGQMEERSLAPAPETNGNATVTTGSKNGLGDFVLPFAVMFILFFVITMSASYMLQSVTREKENRTAEMLLTSLSPRELMLGKVVGLGFVALLQMAVWLGGGQLLLVGGAVAISALAGQALPLSFFLWAFVFFVFGYIVYAAALGALGALAPNMREGSQFTFVLLIPLLVPMWVNSAFMNNPSGPIATALSLFPLTAPTAMVTRLAAGGVPAWQPFVALVGLILTAYFFVLLAARFFRADTLLSGASISWGRITSELRGR